MMKLKKSVFAKSFGVLDKRFLYVILLDFLFFLALALSLFLFSKIFVWALGSFFALPGKLLAMTKMPGFGQVGAAADDLGFLLDQFKSRLFISFFVLWALVVLAFTFVKGPAWAFVSRKKISRRFFLQLFKINALWFAGTALLFFLIFWLVQPAAAGLLIILAALLLLYFTPFVFAVFDSRKSVKEVFAGFWHVAVERFCVFLLPVLLALALLFAGLLLLSALVFSVLPGVLFYVLFAFFVVWQAWIKYYLYLVVRRVK